MAAPAWIAPFPLIGIKCGLSGSHFYRSGNFRTQSYRGFTDERFLIVIDNAGYRELSLSESRNIAGQPGSSGRGGT
jgi:hypothetical protein